MTPYRTLLYLVKRKRRYKKLILPFSFFILETMLVALITLNIFGFNLFNFSDKYASEPMVVIRMIHPPEVVEAAHGSLINVPFISMNNNISPIITTANFMSMGVAIIGLIIAILWMNRFFRLNSLNIEWWLWPVGCVAAHTLFFISII